MCTALSVRNLLEKTLINGKTQLSFYCKGGNNSYRKFLMNRKGAQRHPSTSVLGIYLMATLRRLS